MDSPVEKPRRRLKRRSSSMFNLMDQKNLIEKDMVLSKMNAIRKNNQTRRNYRNDLTVKNRNIDFKQISIEEETPIVNRQKESVFKMSTNKSCKMSIDDLTAEIKYELEYEEKVPMETTENMNVSRIANIKNKINTLKNNFKNIISAKKPTNENAEPKIELKVPTIETNNKISSSFKQPIAPVKDNMNRLQAQGSMRRATSAYNIKPRSACSNLTAKALNNHSNLVKGDSPKKGMRSYESTNSLMERRNNGPVKPAFKLGTKIMYNDRHLFANLQPSSLEIEKFNRLITKRKIAHTNMHGSITSLNSIN